MLQPKTHSMFGCYLGLGSSQGVMSFSLQLDCARFHWEADGDHVTWTSLGRHLDARGPAVIYELTLRF